MGVPWRGFIARIVLVKAFKGIFLHHHMINISSVVCGAVIDQNDFVFIASQCLIHNRVQTRLKELILDIVNGNNDGDFHCSASVLFRQIDRVIVRLPYRISSVCYNAPSMLSSQRWLACEQQYDTICNNALGTARIFNTIARAR